MKLTRRSVIRATAAALAAPALGALPFARGARAQAPTWKHGLSLFGELKYPAGFKHFDYVNPAAPQGGKVRQIAFGTFDNFNQVVAGVKGNLANGLELVIETLMTPALDEVSTEYGLLAEAVSYPDDRSSVTYRLRANARWHDGKPVTPDDVIFSFERVEAEQPAARRLLPPRDQGGKDRRARGHLHLRRGRQPRAAADRRPAAGAAEALVGRHRQERQQARRDADHARAAARLRPLPAQGFRARPHHRLREGRRTTGARTSTSPSAPTISTQIRYEYFRDSTVALEAFKGDQVDWRTENSAKNWATAYDFPAVRDKRVVLEEFPIRNLGVMQAFAFNIRRDKFKDPRVRRAFNFAFDFEEMNKQIFFGQYKRIASYFEGTELAVVRRAAGPGARNPQDGARTRCRPSLFTQALHQSGRRRSAEGAQQSARGARAAARGRLRNPNTKLVNAKTGEPFGVELLVERAGLRARDAVLQALARTSRHHRDGAHRSTARNTRTGCGSGISTSSLRPGANRCRPATSSAASGARRPPTSPARATSSASRIRRSTP